jgi:endonuclease YncB( thermonuclease family)
VGLVSGQEDTREEGGFERPNCRNLIPEYGVHLLMVLFYQIAIRIAGIDAPEGAHFGNEAQPHSAEALAWLRSYILNRRVRAHIYKRDQYDRIVATVFARRGLLRRNVGLEMLKAGMATVYEAKSGAEFGDLEDKYRRVEAQARSRRKGIWSGKQKDFESPRDYKNRINAANEGTKAGNRGILKAVVSTIASSLKGKS